MNRPVGRTPRRLIKKKETTTKRESVSSHSHKEEVDHELTCGLVSTYPSQRKREKRNCHSGTRQEKKKKLTVIFVLVFDLVVEVLDALGHLLLVDRVVNVEIVQIGIGHVGFAVLVQLGRARH